MSNTLSLYAKVHRCGNKMGHSSGHSSVSIVLLFGRERNAVVLNTWVQIDTYPRPLLTNSSLARLHLIHNSNNIMKAFGVSLALCAVAAAFPTRRVSFIDIMLSVPLCTLYLPLIPASITHLTLSSQLSQSVTR
jgi:ABC-type antimicrobial peptide transport system permease subunit